MARYQIPSIILINCGKEKVQAVPPQIPEPVVLRIQALLIAKNGSSIIRCIVQLRTYKIGAYI